MTFHAKSPLTPASLVRSDAAALRGSASSIILDCDGVILDWLAKFQAFAEKRLGRKLCSSGPSNFDLHRWLGVSDIAQALQLIRQFNSGEDGMFGQLPPMRGAQAALKTLANAGRDLHIITACSLSKEVIALRAHNLRTVFGDIFSQIHYVGLQDSKSPLLKEYTRATWVEDKYENAIAGVEAGHKTYLIRASHNLDREASCLVRGLTWVDGWHDIMALEAA